MLSFALTLLYLGLLIVTIASRLDGRGLFGSENFFTDPWIELSVKTSPDDHIAAIVIAVLLIWQGSILFRTILYNRKNILV